MEFRDFAATFADANICSKTVIKSMESECILINLRKILDFLQSNIQEMCYVNMKEDYLPFYYMIIVDKLNLQSDFFTDECKVVASEILKILDNEKNIFSWEISVGNKLKTGLSVFLKKQNKKRQALHWSERFEKPIRIAFKEIWVKTTLQFLKSSRQTLRYPNMPYKEACYLYNAILKQDEEAGFGRDSLWNPVWEAMSIFKLRYEFVVSLCQADFGLLKFVNFEKVKKRKEVSTIENIKAIIANEPSTIDKEFEKTQSISKGVENLNISGKNELKITVSNDDCNTDNNTVQYISDKDSEPLPVNTESTEVNIVNENNNEISCTDNEERSEDYIESHINEVFVNKELANVKTVDSYKNVQEHNEGDMTGNINSDITTQSEEPLSNVLQNERITADDEKVKGFKVISYNNVKDSNGVEAENIDSVSMQVDVPTLSTGLNEGIAVEEKNNEFEVNACNHIERGNQEDLTKNKDSDSRHVDAPALCSALQTDGIIVDDEKIISCNNIKGVNAEDLIENKDSDTAHFKVPILSNELQNEEVTTIEGKIKDFDPFNTNNKDNIITFNTQNVETIKEANDSTETNIGNKVTTVQVTMEVDNNINEPEDILNIIITESVIMENDVTDVQPSMEICIDGNQLENSDNIVITNINNTREMLNEEIKIKSTMEIDTNMRQIENRLSMRDDVSITQPSIEIGADANQIDNTEVTNKSNTQEITNEEIKLNPNMEIDTNMNQLEYTFNITDTDMRNDVTMVQPITKIGIDENQLNNSNTTNVINISNTQEITNEEIKINPNMEIDTNMNQLENTFNITDTDMRNDVTIIQPITEIGIDENQLNNSNTTNVINISNTKEITNEKVKIKSYLKIDTNINQVENLFNITDTDMRKDVISVQPSMEAGIDGNELENSNIIDIKNINNTTGMNEEIHQKSSIEADTNINLPEIGENLNNSKITDVININITNEISNDEIKSTIKTNINLEENSADTKNSTNKYILTPEELELKESTKRTPTSPKSLRRLDLKRKLVHSVSNTFLMNNLETILEFVKDDSRASLEISELSTSEMYVLLRLNTLNPLTASADVFDDDCMNIIVRLFNILNKKTGFKLCSYAPKANKREKKKRYQIVVENLDNVNYKGTVIFMKVPSTSPARNVHKAHKKKKGNIGSETNDEVIDNNDEIGENNEKDTSLQENNEKDASLQENNENMNVDNDDDLEALRNPKSIVEKILQSTEINTKVSRMTPIDPSIYPERSKLSPEPQLLKKSDTWMDFYAYNMPLEFGKPLRTNSSEKKKIFSDHMREMKHKLLEGLAAPIESDKAMRMMRLMGWKGGALGVRGEGIMEPIQPQLDIPTRVGFGHRKLTSSQVKLNRLQKHILKRRTALNQNEELYSKNNEYIEDGTNRKNRKFKKKEKKSKLIGKKGKNKDRRLNEMEANLSMYSTILNDAFAKNDISRSKIDSNDLQTKNNDVTVNFNDLQTEVNDLQDVNASNTSVMKMNTNYIENVDSSSNIENMKNSSISDLEVSNKVSDQSTQIQNNSNYKTDDEMVSDDKIMIIDDNSSDVQIVDDEQDDQGKNSADNEYIRDRDDETVDKDDDYSDVHVIDDTSNQSDQVEVDENCIQTNDVTRALVNEIVMMINDDSCDAQHDSLSNDGQIDSEGDNDDELMINDNQVESDVACSNYVQSDIGASDDDNESEKDDNEVLNQKEEDDKLENSIKTIIDEAFHRMIDNVDINIKNISNVIKAAQQIHFQHENCEQTNDKEVKTNDKGEKTYNEEVKSNDKEVKTDDKGGKNNDKGVIPNDKGVITDDKEVIVEIKYVLAYENEKPSQSIDYVHKSDQMVITNYVQTNDEVIADDDNMIDDNDKVSDNIDNGAVQLDTNCVEINDKKVIADGEKMMIDNDDKSENIDKTINNEEMKGNTDCVQINDKKIISDDECVMNDDNDINFENNDNIFNRQIQVNNFSIRTNDDLNFADENIMIDDNDNDKIDDSLNKDVQIDTNVCNDDEESDIDMNIDTDISYHKISAERYEYNQLDMTAKKASNRLQLLVNMLELIQSEYHFTIIRFGFNISNFISYIITTVSRLNRGERFAYKNKRELLLLKAITAEMAAHSDLALVCQTWKKCNTQVAKISKYNNSPVKLRLYEDFNFVTTHPIPENKYDIPNTSIENKYFLLINRIIRDFIQSNDVQRVYEFSSQVGIKSYVNSVIGMLNGQVIFDLGLGGEENDIYCETVERMADVFLIAKYDCPLLYFGKLQLVKVFVTKRCKMCQQGTNSEAENSNNDKIIHENSKNNEEFDGEVNNNSSMKNSPNETVKVNQNGDMNNIPKTLYKNKCNNVIEGNDFGIGSHDSKTFDVKSYEIENTEISKNDKIFDEDESNKNISTNSQNKSNSDFEKNIDNITEFDKKLTKRKLLEENICNKEILTSDDVNSLIRNEDKNEETEEIRIDGVMEKHREVNEEINKEISNEDIIEKIAKFIEDFDKAHGVNKSTEKKRRRIRRNRKKNDGDNEEFNIGEGVKNHESIYTGNKLQYNSTYTQNYIDNILNCDNEISKHIENNPIVNSNDITKNTDEKVFAVSNPNIVTKNGTWPKNVIIMIKHSPLCKIDFLKSVTHIQSIIYEAIKMSNDIPYIKCEGLKTNGIVYSCFNDKSFNWLVNTVGPHYNILDFKSDLKSSHIIELRIYSFIKVDPKVILNNIQLCYGLNTGEWKVMWERYFPKCYILTIKIDDASLSVIKKENYSLFVGFDKADVILWQVRDY